GAMLVVGALTWWTGAGGAMAGIGIGMMVGGAVMLLTPVPKLSVGQAERDAGKPSYLFNGPINTSAQGAVVPVGAGIHRVGGIIVSAGISVEDMA
ncbi:hypothetical protein QR66_16545, partial [Chromobacterium piscinae]